MSSIRIPVEDSIIGGGSFKTPYSWLVPVRDWIQSSSDRSWYRILAITGTASGAVVVTYYIVKKCTSSGAKRCGLDGSEAKRCGLDGSEAKRCGLDGSEAKKCGLNGSVRTRNGSLVASRPATLSKSPVKSKARNEFEHDVIDGPPSDVGMSSSNAEDAGGDCGSQCPQLTTPRSFRRRNRSDSIVSGTTTLMLTSRDPSQLLLYGLESLKRSVRLWEEARNKLVGSDASGK